MAVEARGVLLGVTGVPSLPGVPAERQINEVIPHSQADGQTFTFTTSALGKYRSEVLIYYSDF